MKGKPLTREDGVPFEPMDFLGLYLGLAYPVAEQPGPTADDAGERIDVWAEGVRLMFGDACMGVRAQDYWLKVQKGMGESQDRTLCQQVILGGQASADDLATAPHWPAPVTWRS